MASKQNENPQTNSYSLDMSGMDDYKPATFDSPSPPPYESQYDKSTPGYGPSGNEFEFVTSKQGTLVFFFYS